MRDPEQPTGHDDPEELPLLTESARVTAVQDMDASRVDEVLDALADLVNEHVASPESSREGQRRWIRERVEDETLADAFEPDAPDRVLDAVDALAARYRRPFPSLVRLDLETEDPVDFVPGQYLSLRYEDTTRPYSVASSPSSTNLEFCVRRVPGGDLTPELTNRLGVGDEVTLRGPYGEFVMEEPSRRDLVFLATGTGVAPLRSMIEHVFATGEDDVEGDERDVWLVLGCGWWDDLPYRERFRELASEHANFHFVPTLSREQYLTDWDGETAYVQYTLAKHLDADAVSPGALPESFRPYLDADPATDIDARIDPERAEVYACGINAMVNALEDAADAIGVPEKHVHSEGFG